MGRQLQTLRQETLKFILPVTMVAANDVSAMAQSGKSPNSKEASPVKVTESDTVDPKQEAANCLAVGKRNLLVSDIPLAVSSLGEACELFTKVYGETAPECAETDFYYGKALLEMARLESGVLGNALDGVPEGEEEAENSQVEDPEKLTEDEKDDVEQKVDEALNENFDKHDKIAKIHNGENGEGEDDESQETENEEGEDENDAASGEADGEKEKNGEAETAMETESKSEDGETVEGGEKEGEDKNEQEAEDEEDPSNLQLAWEML